MARTRRGALQASQLVKLILLLLVALGTAWLSVSTYLPRALPDRFGAATDPRQIYLEAGQELVAGQGRLENETYRRLAEAAQREPLDFEPFLFFGMRALAEGERDTAERLLAESRQRNPRYALARIALMALYLRTGRIREGSDELATLVRVLPRAGQTLVPELARLATDPNSRDAVEQAIGDEPIMADVLNLLVQQNVDLDVVLGLAARQPRSSDGRFSPWQASVLAKLVDGGDVRRAHELWRRFVGAGETGLVYDPEFRGEPGPPPFNWELTGNAVGAAERGRGGGLELEYYGRQAGPLARQLLLLRPGRYRLEFQVEGSATGQGSRIVAQVACRGRDAPLLAIRLENLTAASRKVSGDFAVPGGCEAQWLAFNGEAVEFPTTQRARVTGLTLRPAGS